MKNRIICCFVLNLTSRHHVFNHIIEHGDLNTLLVGEVGVEAIEVPPFEASLGVLQVGGGLRIDDDEVVGFSVFVQVGFSDVFVTDQFGLLSAAVEVEVEVAVGGGAREDGVAALGGDGTTLRRNVDVTSGGHGVGGGRGTILGLVEGVEVVLVEGTLRLEGGEVLALVGHGLPSAREVFTGEVVLAVVDVGFTEVRAGVSVLVGDPSVFGGVVEDGGDGNGTHVFVHFGDLLHDTLVDDGISSTGPQVEVVVLDVIHIVDQTFCFVSLGGADGSVDVDEFGRIHAHQGVGHLSLGAVVRDTSNDTVGVDLGGVGNTVLDGHDGTSRDTRDGEGIIADRRSANRDRDGLLTITTTDLVENLLLFTKDGNGSDEGDGEEKSNEGVENEHYIIYCKAVLVFLSKDFF